MAKATLNANQMAVLRAARDLDEGSRSNIRKEIFTSAKLAFGIPADHKLRVEIDNQTNPLYGVLVRKKGETTYDLDYDGKAGSPLTQATNRWFIVTDGMDVEDIYNGVVYGFDDGVDVVTNVLTEFSCDERDFVVTNAGAVFVRVHRDDLDD